MKKIIDKVIDRKKAKKAYRHTKSVVRKGLRRAEKVRKATYNAMSTRNPYGTGESMIVGKRTGFEGFHPYSNFYGSPLSVRRKSKYKYNGLGF